MELKGRVAFGRMEAVTFGRPANEALLEEIKNYDFVILVSSIICHETELNVLKKIHESSDT